MAAVTTRRRQAWYLRSLGDADTHLGVYSPASRSVLAVCGAEFQPVPVGLQGQHLALPGQPRTRTRCAPTAPRGHTSITTTPRMIFPKRVFQQVILGKYPLPQAWGFFPNGEAGGSSPGGDYPARTPRCAR